MAVSHPRNARLGAVQSLQQFINQSPWDWFPVRESLARAICTQASPRAWVVSEATIPRRGNHSVGVTRRFIEAEGRVVNCQRGLGIFLATACGALPVDWSLELDDEWINAHDRRERTRVPPHVSLRSDADHMLDMVDRLSCRWRLPAAPVVSRVRSRHTAGRLVCGLAERKLDFLLEVPESLVAASGWGTSSSGGPHRSCVVRAGSRRYGFAIHSLPFRVPGAGPGPGVASTVRILSGSIPSDGRSKGFWVTNVSPQRIDDLLDLSLLHRQSMADLREMCESFGLRDFEGRSYPGWHHHMTLVSAAFSYWKLATESTQPLPISATSA